MAIYSKLFFKFTTIIIKISADLFAEINKMILIFICKYNCGERIMAPKHAHVPEPGNCLIYMAKGTFVDMIKLRNLS